MTNFVVGGPLTDENRMLYIERESDSEALRYIQDMSYVLLIESRQQGKTSLVNYLSRHPLLSSTIIVYVDMSTLHRSTEETWYHSLCTRLLDQLKTATLGNLQLPIPHNSFEWRDFLVQMASLVAMSNRRIVIVLDEIGSSTFPAATDFYAVLREIFNQRQFQPELKRLTFMLVGAFNPRDLIEDPRISPFNIAARVRLPDFTLDQIATLLERGGLGNVDVQSMAKRIYYWTNGQPYLSQLLCSYLTSSATVDAVDKNVSRLRREDENHLPPIRARLESDSRLREYFHKIAAGNKITFFPRENRQQGALELLGVIKMGDDENCAVRNRIYELSLLPESNNVSESETGNDTQLTDPNHDQDSNGQGISVIGDRMTGSSALTLLTLRFATTAEGVTITWESIIGGTSISSFVSPYTNTDLSLVIKALDAVQHPDHPRHGPQFPAEEQQRLSTLELWQHGRVRVDAHQLVGQRLYAALIADRKGEIALSTVRNSARSQGHSLTYVLRFPTDAVELAALPWEALWDTRQAVLLSRGGRQIDSLERYLDLEEALSPPLPTGKQLHILALSPQAGIPQHVRDDERAARLQSWKALKERGLLDWDELSPVTTVSLYDRMQHGPTPDIIHYYGHGIYRDGQGYLQFDSATIPGQYELVSTNRLSAILGGIRLIMIHACQSAMIDDAANQKGLLTGIAPALSVISEAVVAMQLTVRISAATRFSEVFYKELARGRSLQAAVAEARRSLYFIEDDGASWYVPTLYIRTREQGPVYLVQMNEAVTQ